FEHALETARRSVRQPVRFALAKREFIPAQKPAVLVKYAQAVPLAERNLPVPVREQGEIAVLDHHGLGNAAGERGDPLREEPMLAFELFFGREKGVVASRLSAPLVFFHVRSPFPEIAARRFGPLVQERSAQAAAPAPI